MLKVGVFNCCHVFGHVSRCVSYPSSSSDTLCILSHSVGLQWKMCNYLKDIHLHRASWEQWLPFLFREHLLFMMALSQHQEAKCAEDGYNQQGQKNVSPAVVWDRKIKVNRLMKMC